MAPPKTRGFLVLFEGALITGGIMVSYWYAVPPPSPPSSPTTPPTDSPTTRLNYGFWFVNQNSFQWRFPLAFQAVFGLILIGGILLFPESPRWLLKHGRDEDALQILANLHSTTVDDAELLRDVDEIKKVNAITTGRRLTVKEFFSNGPEKNGWRAGVAFASQAFQQIGGINLVTYYATTVFETSLSFSPELSRLMSGFLGTEYFLAAVLALFIVDRLGRRRLMMWGALGMALCLLIIGICLSQTTPSYRAPAYAATVFIFVYNTCFAVGWLGVTWLYPAEVTPIRIRAEANGLSTSANWIFNYAVVQLSPIMINRISWQTYFVFMCFNLAFVPVVYFTFVETNGYKLETMDGIFAEAHEKGENPVWTEKRVRKGGELDVVVTREKGNSSEGKRSRSLGGEERKERV
ncbi:putative mfs sugar transporter protein [Lasiodiplodia theobromae]|nr:putative mfs sugar transporter protein [Lasiodiplodia theobromae]